MFREPFGRSQRASGISGVRKRQSPIQRGRQRLARLQELTSKLVSGLSGIGVETSAGKNPGVIMLHGQVLDGAVVPWRNASPEHAPKDIDVDVLYFVLNPDHPSLHEDWISLAPSVRISQHKSFPIFGAVDGVRFTFKSGVFEVLGAELQRDEEVSQLLLRSADAWRLIDIAPIMVGDQTWPPAGMALETGLAVPSRELFDSYERIGRHMRRSLDNLLRHPRAS